MGKWEKQNWKCGIGDMVQLSYPKRQLQTLEKTSRGPEIAFFQLKKGKWEKWEKMGGKWEKWEVPYEWIAQT